MSLECESGAGTVVNDDVTASMSDPANFTLNDVTNDNKTCTATESPVPAGYTASNDGSCTAKVKELGCTITNTAQDGATTGSITVEKKINGPPGETQEFRFVLSGNPEELLLSDGESGTWDGLQPGTTYTVTEVEPTGWRVSKISCRPGSDTTNTNAATVVLGDASGDPAHLTPICTFTNEESGPSSAPFTVVKDFEPSSDASVSVSLKCTSGDVAESPLDASESEPAEFSVEGFTTADDTTCTATEDVPAGYSASGVPPGTCSATLAAGTCTITNTLNGAPFTVHKDFSDDSDVSVSVSLECTSGDVAELAARCVGERAGGVLGRGVHHGRRHHVHGDRRRARRVQREW